MVVLGLGSNWGDRLGYLRSAIQKLKSPVLSPQIQVLTISPIYESNALLPQNSPTSWDQPFLNCNVLCTVNLEPLELLKHIKSVEEVVGRKSRGRWAPREIDIDILVMDSLVFESESLNIPHPGLLERPFALFPLADLLPNWKFSQHGPHFGQTASTLASDWRKKYPAEVPFQTRRSNHSLTELVGILNVTPDSFSDGGSLPSPEAVLERARQFVSQGVRILDVGAESTRPGATEVSPQEEWNRLEPVLKDLRTEFRTSGPFPILLSVDTRHAEVAARAIEAGANWINDVTGLNDPAMQNIVATSSVEVVIMHSLVVPPRYQTVISPNVDPVTTLLEWGEKRIQELTRRGISRERIIFDPGFGFGKTAAQSWEILRGMRKFQELGVRILVGHSRKSFLSSITNRPAEDRDAETSALSVDLASKGVNFLRVHNADINARSLKVWSQVNGITQCSP